MRSGLAGVTLAWVRRQGGVVVHATRDFTVKTVQKAADIAMQTGSRLYTDSARSYRALTGYVHDSSITPRRNTRGVTSMKIGLSVSGCSGFC